LPHLFRQDLKAGNTDAVKADRADIQKDRRDPRSDRHIRGDRRDLAEDQRDLRRGVADRNADRRDLRRDRAGPARRPASASPRQGPAFACAGLLAVHGLIKLAGHARG
jgi:hypothetical protein